MCRGELTIEDVCAPCNNGRLSKLDNYAGEWWDRNVQPDTTELDAEEPILGRWLGKIAYNMQRIERRERPGPTEAPIPDEAVRWIIGHGPLSGAMGICVGALPLGHDSTLNAGHDRPRTDVPLPLRTQHFQALVFMIVWRDARWAITPDEMTALICKSMPAVPLDLVRGRGPKRMPEIRSPDFVEKGFYGNLELMDRVLAHWKKQEARGD